MSKGYRDIAQFLLYREFLPCRGGHGELPEDVLRRWNAQIDSFVRTITRRRDLAAVVKRVTFNAYLLKVGPEACWTHPLMTIAFVTSGLPNLEQYSLDFRSSLGYDSSHFKILISRQRLGSGRPPLHGGSEYFFRLLDSASTVETCEGVSLRTLNLRLPTAYDRSSGCRQSAILRLRIETLRVTQSGLSPGKLGELLSSCIGLGTFI